MPWNKIFRRVDVAWVMPLKVVDLLVCWKEIQGCPLIKKKEIQSCPQVAAVWKMIPLYVMWCCNILVLVLGYISKFPSKSFSIIIIMIIVLSELIFTLYFCIITFMMLFKIARVCF